MADGENAGGAAAAAAVDTSSNGNGADDDVGTGAGAGYTVPEKKSVEQLLNQDTEDESLQKYKATLLGDAGGAGALIFPNDPRRVIIQKMTLIPTDHESLTLDLSGGIEGNRKDRKFIIKEGVEYRVEFAFYVQREIVSGLKCSQAVFRKGIRVDKQTYMMGSYGPKPDLQSFKTTTDEAPSGMLARGEYKVHTQFVDDDKHTHMSLEWTMEIKKGWAA